MCGRSFAVRLVAGFGKVRVVKGAESYDFAERNVGERTVAFVIKGCTNSPVTTIDAVAVTNLFDSRPSRSVRASRYVV